MSMRVSLLSVSASTHAQKLGLGFKPSFANVQSSFEKATTLQYRKSKVYYPGQQASTR
jgi:hypothetical protein